jgi:hypothetical protein
MLKLILAILIVSGLSCATLTNNVYDDAIKEINSGNIDFGFMQLSNFLRENPGSIYKPKIRFAMIEYYFQNKSYRNALDEVVKYIIDYPNEISGVFAQAILYRILQDYNGEPSLIEKIKENFFSKSVFLTFSDSKTKSYTSILNNTYKIVDYLDRVEVYKNNALLLEITP